MKCITVALVLAALALAATAKPLWHQLDAYSFEQYESDFMKQYSTARERMFRKAIFELELSLVHSHNKDTTKTWKIGVNHFSDWTNEEFKATLGYNKAYGYSRHQPASAADKAANTVYPHSIDWRREDVVTAVKDQGFCGSCWTFASTETIESRWAILTGNLPVLSEQMILNCVPNPTKCGGTGGCQGGTAELAFDTLAKSYGGIASEWTFPYTSYHSADFPCAFDPSPKGTPIFANVTGFTKLGSNAYAPLMDAIQTGPVAISVEAILWKNYESGIFDGCNQTNPDIDHAVQLVGYGTDSSLGGDYWLVRNSWSPVWGEQGYIRVRRTNFEESRCGVDLSPQDGSGCPDGPPTVNVCGTCGILFDNVIPTLV
jgi:cathepsin L